MDALALTWRELRFPADLDAAGPLAFCRLLAMRPLHGWGRQPDPVVCEIVSTPTGLRWQLGVTDREASLLLPQMRAQLANIATERTERRLPPLDAALELRLNNNAFPLRTDIADAVAAALLTALSGVGRGEALVLSWVIGPWLERPAVRRGQSLSLFAPPLEADEATALRAKLAEPVLGVVGRIGVHAATPARRIQLTQRVLGALEISRAAGVALVVRMIGPQRAAVRLIHHRGPLHDWPCQLNAAELATVLGWPVGNPPVRGVTYSGHRQLPPAPGNWVAETTAATAPPGRYRILGHSTYPGRGGFVHLPMADALHHLHVVGPTGTGKSVLLGHLIQADIAAGRTVIVVEPKADLIASVLDRIPDDRTDDVVLLDPTDPDHAVGLNPLAGNPELAADRFVHVVHALNPDSWGPRTSQVLHAAALTLARAGHTLAELPHLLTNPGYRARLVTAQPDPLGTGPFWAWYDALSNAERNQVIAPSLNRLTAFLARPAIRAMVGQTTPRFTLGDVFTGPGRILLVNLARGAVGPESARLLGALVLSQLWEAALARTTTPARRRHPAALFIDEFHEYTAGLPVDFGDVLAQSRGLGVAVTVAHQGLHQLDTTTRAGVLSNTRSRIAFQVSADTEARALAAALGGGITSTDLTALGAFEAYATLTSHNATTPPTSLATLPPTPPQGTAPTVRERSRQQWAVPAADVDAAILARRQSPPDPSPTGRRPRRPQ